MGDLSKHFSRFEFACRCGCGFDTADVELVQELEGVRVFFGRPVHVTSAARCPTYNKAVGGAADSEHLNGKGADFRVRGIPADEVAEYLMAKFTTKYGIGRYDGRTHFDVRRGMARWDNRES